MNARYLSDGVLASMIHTRCRAYSVLASAPTRDNRPLRHQLLLELQSLRAEADRRIGEKVAAPRCTLPASYAGGWAYGDSARRKANAINLGVLPVDHARLFRDEHGAIRAVLVSIHHHELFVACGIGLDQISDESKRLGLRVETQNQSYYYPSAIDFLYIVEAKHGDR